MQVGTPSCVLWLPWFLTASMRRIEVVGEKSVEDCPILR